MLSALFLSSYKSATSRIKVPRAVDVVSEKSAKKELIRAAAVMELFLKEEMCERNWASFEASFCRRTVARSITAPWRNWRACSCDVSSGATVGEVED